MLLDFDGQTRLLDFGVGMLMADGEGGPLMDTMVLASASSQMLDYTAHHDLPCLRLLVNHDDGDREFAYEAGSERALARGEKAGWTVVSMKDDWTTLF